MSNDNVLPFKAAVPPPFPVAYLDDDFSMDMDHQDWLVEVGRWVRDWGWSLRPDLREFWEKHSVSPEEEAANQARIARDTAKARARQEESRRKKGLGPWKINPAWGKKP